MLIKKLKKQMEILNIHYLSLLTKSIILVEISGKNEADYLFSTEYLNFKLKNESKFLFKMAYLGILKHVKISACVNGDNLSRKFS